MPGLKPLSQIASTVLGLFMSFTLQADEYYSDESQRTEAGLPAAFLEFLGEWGDQEDPMEFADPRWESLIEEAKQQNDTD